MFTGISGSKTVLIAATAAGDSASVRAASTGPNAVAATGVAGGATSASTLRSGLGGSSAIGGVVAAVVAAGVTAAVPAGGSASAVRPVSLLKIENIGQSFLRFATSSSVAKSPTLRVNLISSPAIVPV